MPADVVIVRFKKKDFEAIATNGVVDVDRTLCLGKVVTTYDDFPDIKSLLFRFTSGKEDNVMYQLSEHALHEIRRIAGDPETEWDDPDVVESLSADLEKILMYTDFHKKSIAVYWI